MSTRFDTPEKRRKWADYQGNYLSSHPEQVQKKRDRAKRRYQAAKQAKRAGAVVVATNARVTNRKREKQP